MSTNDSRHGFKCMCVLALVAGRSLILSVLFIRYQTQWYNGRKTDAIHIIISSGRVDENIRRLLRFYRHFLSLTLFSFALFSHFIPFRIEKKRQTSSAKLRSNIIEKSTIVISRTARRRKKELTSFRLIVISV